MSSVQIEQKSYEMPPKEGMSIAHFLTVGDINRSLDVGHGEKMRDADPLSRGHLIAVLFDLYAAH